MRALLRSDSELPRLVLCVTEKVFPTCANEAVEKRDPSLVSDATDRGPVRSDAWTMLRRSDIRAD